MYKIGDFSKIVNIPVRTLRYYDQCGILQPSEVNALTGYRYYSEEDVIECEFIKLLKSLDFTLEEIAQYKNCLDEEIIKKKKKEIEERMYLLKLKYERLTTIQKEFQNEKYHLRKVKELPKEKVLRRKYEKRIIGKRV